MTTAVCPEMTDDLKGDLIEAFRKGRRNLVEFRRILLPTGPDDVAPAGFHYLWSDLLLNDTEHEAIEGYRESAKTQYVIRAFLLYALMFPSRDRDYIVIIKKNQTLAERKLKEIEREFQSLPYWQERFCEVLEESAGVLSVNLKNDEGEIVNVRIEAYGKGASIRGLADVDRRPKIVIVDDPQDKEDARSPAVQEADWDWFLSDVMFLGKKTRIFLIGNNLGEKCIIERVFAMAGQLDYVKFKTMRIAELTPEGESAWPEKATKEDILAEKEDYRRAGKLDIWLMEKMCQAVGEETRIFNPADYRYFAQPLVDKLMEGRNRFAALDPAASTNKTSCYRAIVVCGVDSDNHWLIPDIKYGRWDSVELIEQIFTTVRQWEIKNFGIEKGQLKDFLEPLLVREMARQNCFFTIIPIEHAKAGTKLERIKALQPRFKANLIWVPQDAPWVTEFEAELAGVTKDEIKSMYIDLVDALAMLEQFAKPPFRASTRTLDRRQIEKIRTLAPEVRLI